jgi:hypothetical protein
MNAQYSEICLHYLKAHLGAAWNQAPVRLDVYADGEPQDCLTKYNGGSNVWDLSDQCYRFNHRIQFDLIEENGTDEGLRIASFTMDGHATGTCGAESADLSSGYAMSFTTYHVGMRLAA